MRDLRCATEEDIREWVKFHRVAATDPHFDALDSFCGDCTIAYRREMKAEGRCIRE